MLLDKPALKLNIGVQDILGILEQILKQKNWTNFDVANLKLLYIPFYLFNYDTLIEGEVQGQPFSQGFSGLMAMNAITGELEPMLSDTMQNQSVEYEKEITHEMKYELQQPAIKLDEAKQAAAMKLAGQFQIRKKDVVASGLRLVYWPIWRMFVQLKGGTQRIDVDAVSGAPLNFEQVPTREKTWMEVTQDTLGKLKSPEGIAEIGGKAVSGAATATSKAGSSMDFSGAINWLLKTRAGQYTLLAIAAGIALLFLL